uniref:Uncharacterized protein n=1 Tax=Phenylobacterium glaciei TaxID=2803784 RepID=A0A974P614_9CAUL|nr:hypothetical protein JKL49_12855 [Phenylobacterium glaciei]
MKDLVMRPLLPATFALALIAAPAFAQDSATDASAPRRRPRRPWVCWPLRA